MKAAIVIGHSLSSSGASNKSYGVNEFQFNEQLAHDVAQGLTKAGIDHEVIYREQYKDLPNKINAIKPDCIISLHCNAFNGQATGTETLYYHKSINSKLLANICHNNIVSALGLTDRGLLPRHSEDRGGYLLRYTDAPCVILEPFFIDNDNDFREATEKYDLLVSAIILSIMNFTV